MANPAATWGELSITKKIIALLVLGGVTAGLIVLFLWSQKPEYSLLFSNLSPEDSGQILEKLKQTAVPYKVSSDSGTIYVSAEKVYELRMQLAGEGLPQGGGIGYEIFDKTTLGMTEFVQKLNYRRALQGELARTIGQLSEVLQARVHLVIPEKSLFREDQEKARASIITKLKPGRSLSQNQIQGIVHLVASSVEGLNPQNITIIDNHGQVLSKPGGDSLTEVLNNSQFDYQHRLEKEVEKKIQSMLEHTVGRDKVEVRVSALLDFTQKESTEEKFDPDSVVIRSEQKANDKSSGAVQVFQGVRDSGLAGFDNNTEIAGRSGTPSLAQRQSETTNYEINKVVNRIVEPTGKLKRLSVAVLVDGSYKVEGKDRKYFPREDGEIKKYEEMVKKAMGYSEERNDQVIVTNMPFESAIMVEEELPEEKKPLPLLPLIKYGIIGLGVILLILFGLRPIIAMISAPPRLSADQELLEAISRESITSHAGSGKESLAAPATAEAKKSREELLKTIKEKPEIAARLIKSWMAEK